MKGEADKHADHDNDPGCDTGSCGPSFPNLHAPHAVMLSLFLAAI